MGREGSGGVVFMREGGVWRSGVHEEGGVSKKGACFYRDTNVNNCLNLMHH